MNLTKLALPASILALAATQGFQQPAALVHIDGIVNTKEAPALRVLIRAGQPYTVPPGHSLRLLRFLHGGGTGGYNVSVNIDGNALAHRYMNWGEFPEYDLGGAPVAAGSVVSSHGSNNPYVTADLIPD
jgi:hypothetical protein